MGDEWEDKKNKKKWCDFLLGGNNREISQLPSGWKHQIVLRSIMLAHNEHIFLIDEPENSLYPHEQEELTNFLLENSADRRKKHQFFIATHSPFVLKRFLNDKDTVIIDVENGENLKKSEKKKLLLIHDNIVSYDEIIYLYFGIATSGYYLSLFEKLKSKITGIEKKDQIKFSEVDEWLYKRKKIEKTIFLGLNHKGENSRQTELVRLRHLLGHGNEGEEEYKYYVDNKELFKKEEKTSRFYERYNNNFEELLRESIETIRKLIIELENNLNS